MHTHAVPLLTALLAACGMSLRPRGCEAVEAEIQLVGGATPLDIVLLPAEPAPADHQVASP